MRKVPIKIIYNPSAVIENAVEDGINEAFRKMQDNDRNSKLIVQVQEFFADETIINHIKEIKERIHIEVVNSLFAIIDMDDE